MTELEEQLQSRLNKAIEVFKQKESEIAELKATIENKNKAYKILQDTYNDVFAQNTQLTKELDLATSKLIVCKQEIDELRSQVSWLDENIDNLQARNEVLTTKLEESIKIQTTQQQINQEKKSVEISVQNKHENQNIFTPVTGAFTI